MNTSLSKPQLTSVSYCGDCSQLASNGFIKHYIPHCKFFNDYKCDDCNMLDCECSSNSGNNENKTKQSNHPAMTSLPSITYDNCPICYEPRDYAPIDGPSNSDIPTECRHFLCIHCWENIWELGKSECPICRTNVVEWLYSHYPMDTYSSVEDDSTEDDTYTSDSDNAPDSIS